MSVPPEGDPPPIDFDAVLRAAQAPWQKDGYGIRGGTPTVLVKQPDPPPEGRYPLKIDKQEESQPFPAPEPEQQTSEASEDATELNEYAFKLLLKSIDQTLGTVDVLVTDGEMNSEFPTGMTGVNDYVLTLDAPGKEIYGIITYDPDTLDITSRTLAFATSVPDSSLGVLNVPIGYVDWTVTTGPPALIVAVKLHNRQCGDINVGFLYGSLNRAPALFAPAQVGAPQPIV